MAFLGTREKRQQRCEGVTCHILEGTGRVCGQLQEEDLTQSSVLFHQVCALSDLDAGEGDGNLVFC